jgi:hypothetical protein
MYVKTGETGVLFKGNSREEILKALKYIEAISEAQYKRMSENCVKSAYTDFNYKSYITDFKHLIELK